MRSLVATVRCSAGYRVILPGVPRKQLGMVDDELLARVDERAAELGQTRRVFTERALEAALSEAKGTGLSEQADTVPVLPPGGVMSAASPRALAPNVVGSPALARFGQQQRHVPSACGRSAPR